MISTETTRDRPLVAAGLDTSLGTPFVQARLALLGKVLSLLGFAFFIVLNTMTLATGKVPWSSLLELFNLMHLLAGGLMGLLWAVARRGQLSLRTLGVLDAGSLILVCVAWRVMAAYGHGEAVTAGLLATMVTAIARGILVPSSGKRTFWLTSFAVMPLMGVVIMFHAPPAAPPGMDLTPGFMKALMVVNTALWLGVAVLCSTVASRTIYGLRKQVSEATDIGQYTLEARLGSGGMGEVWRARHRLLIRPAAVKLIRPQNLGSVPGDPDVLLRRFEREARATAALKSPHTVQLYDFGVADDGTLYYVMELLEGMDLETLVRRFGPVPAERAAHILTQVCLSLADAHGNGLVHRDIKPANVVLSRVGAEWDFVKVLDFGLVKLEGPKQSDESVKLTAVGAVSGTPAFMAPEVALGEPAIDHRVDIYSLGCVAYWLVTGQLLFDGSTAMKVMFAHAHTAPPAPSTRVELPIPPALEALILECLEKDPAKRPQSAAALQKRLSDLARAHPWTPADAERWWSRHAPPSAESRPAAEVLLSQEARPLRVVRRVGN